MKYTWSVFPRPPVRKWHSRFTGFIISSAAITEIHLQSWHTHTHTRTHKVYLQSSRFQGLHQVSVRVLWAISPTLFVTDWLDSSFNLIVFRVLIIVGSSFANSEALDGPDTFLWYSRCSAEPPLVTIRMVQSHGETVGHLQWPTIFNPCWEEEDSRTISATWHAKNTHSTAMPMIFQ
jgi:hypothetical protein